MNYMSRHRVSICYSAIFSVFLVLPSLLWGQKPTSYDVVVLSTPDVTRGVGIDMDDFGNVVGQFTLTSGQETAFYYQADLDLLLPLAGGTAANGTNNRQEVVGMHVNQATAVTNAIYWSGPLAAPVTLPVPSGHNAVAESITFSGLVAGHEGDVNTLNALVWDVSGVKPSAPLALAPLPGDLLSHAYDICDSEDGTFAWVVGYSRGSRTTGTERAVRWTVWVDGDGVLQGSHPEPLDSLNDEGHSVAHRVNALGDACGVSGLLPILKLAGEPLIELPVPRRAEGGFAGALTNNGTIAGFARFPVNGFGGLSNWHACLWQSGEAIDLNKRVRLDRGDVLRSSYGVTEDGKIMGSGDFGGRFLPYLLLPN